MMSFALSQDVSLEMTNGHVKMIRGMPYRQVMTTKAINGWRDVKHLSLPYISFQMRDHFSLPAVWRWFELAPPSPQRMSCNDANLGPFCQDLDTWYVGQLPVLCWFYQTITIESTGTGGKKRRKTRKTKIGLKSWTLFCCSVTDLQPHLLLHHTIGAKVAQKNRCLGWACLIPKAKAQLGGKWSN